MNKCPGKPTLLHLAQTHGFGGGAAAASAPAKPAAKLAVEPKSTTRQVARARGYGAAAKGESAHDARREEIAEKLNEDLEKVTAGYGTKAKRFDDSEKFTAEVSISTVTLDSKSRGWAVWELQVLDWIREVTGDDVARGQPHALHVGLKDGVTLCKLANALCAGNRACEDACSEQCVADIVPKIHTKNLERNHMKCRENIKFFRKVV